MSKGIFTKDYDEIEIGKNVFRDDVLAPEPSFNFSYKGGKPSSIMGITDMIEELTGKAETLTDSISGSKSSDGTKNFSGSWSMNVGYDQWTKFHLDISVNGNEKDGEGKASVSIYPYIETTIEVDSALQLVFWKMWVVFYYRKKRMEYLNSARGVMGSLKKSLVENFGIGVRIE